MLEFKIPQPEYTEYSYQKLLILPLTLIAVSFLIVSGWFIVYGEPIDRGMVFTGGSEIRVSVDDNVENPQVVLDEMYDGNTESITSVSGQNEYIVQFSEGTFTAEEIEEPITNAEEFSVEQLSSISPSIGDEAQQLAVQAMLFAFVLMSIFVFILYRTIVPSLIVILSVVTNILITVATMNIIGVELTMGTVGALLMLIGYSIDSDILLNTQVIKQKNRSFIDNVHEAMKTGITMNVTSISAMVTMAILATIFQIGLLADMGIVLATGLLSDLIITYLLNVTILRWYTENNGDTL